MSRLGWVVIGLVMLAGCGGGGPVEVASGADGDVSIEVGVDATEGTVGDREERGAGGTGQGAGCGLVEKLLNTPVTAAVGRGESLDVGLAGVPDEVQGAVRVVVEGREAAVGLLRARGLPGFEGDASVLLEVSEVLSGAEMVAAAEVLERFAEECT